MPFTPLQNLAALRLVISRRMWLLLNDLRNEGDTAFDKHVCSALTPIDAMDYAARVQQAWTYPGLVDR